LLSWAELHDRLLGEHDADIFLQEILRHSLTFDLQHSFPSKVSKTGVTVLPERSVEIVVSSVKSTLSGTERVKRVIKGRSRTS
jgi:hypothetical protein